MTGFKVDPPALIKAAEAGELAETVRRIDVRTPILGVAQAMPGSQSAATSESLGPHLAVERGRWANALDEHARKLASAVTDIYWAIEEQTKTDLEKRGPR